MPVTYDAMGPVAILTLNRPEARNAINQEMADAIEAVSYTHLTLPTILLV